VPNLYGKNSLFHIFNIIFLEVGICLVLSLMAVFCNFIIINLLLLSEAGIKPRTAVIRAL
jgi:hypothetical protein